MNTRAIAAGALLRITDEGAYSNVLLPSVTKDLSQLDRAFVYRLVTDALRNIRRADHLIEQATSRQVEELDTEVLAVLRIAAAEMVTGESKQVHATVNESVEAVRQLDNPRAAGFVNAILRRLGRDGVEDEVDASIALSIPNRLYATIVEAHGEDEAALLLGGLRRSGPPTPIRVRPGGQAPTGAEAVEGIAGAFYIDGPIKADAGISVSDAASTAVGLAVRPRRGERVLDMAAAPGGKTLHLWDMADGEIDVIALDRHQRRLRSARSRLASTGAKPTWIRGDGTKTPFADGVFDAVLLDAPCTGLGTLRRRPEIAMRLTAGSPARLASQQKALLGEAWRVTRPGGRIVYSVCTVSAEETVDVVDDYPASPPADLPGRQWGKGLLLAPHLTGTDAMFISVIDRTA